LFLSRALGAYALALSLAVAGCHSMARISHNEGDSKPIEIRFMPPRNVDAVQADGTRRWLPQVVRASGTVGEVRGDSVTLNLGSWVRAGDKGEHRESLSATIATNDAGVGYYQRRFSKGKTLVLLASIAGVIALGVGQASIGTPGNIGGVYDVLHFLP